MTHHEMNRMTRFAAPIAALALATAATLGSIAAMAQTPAPSAPETKAPAAQAPQSPGAAAKPDAAPAAKSADMVGMPVVDSTGKSVGSVSKVERLPNGELRTVEISTGGFLGFGAKTIRVPAEKVQRSGEQVVLNLPPEQIKTMTQ